MPEVRKHIDQSVRRTGREYKEVHEWLDDAQKKKERHDVTRMMEFGTMFRERYGEESLKEYVAHLHDDMKGKFGHLVEDTAKAAEKVLDRQAQSLRELRAAPSCEPPGPSPAEVGRCHRHPG